METWRKANRKHTKTWGIKLKIENKHTVEEDNNIVVSFTKDEALVLFDWLVQLNENGNINLHNEQAVKKILFDLESIFEEVLSVVFDNNYKRLLKEAKERIKNKD